MPVNGYRSTGHRRGQSLCQSFRALIFEIALLSGNFLIRRVHRAKPHVFIDIYLFSIRRCGIALNANDRRANDQKGNRYEYPASHSFLRADSY
jgi:hypothetical protein